MDLKTELNVEYCVPQKFQTGLTIFTLISSYETRFTYLFMKLEGSLISYLTYSHDVVEVGLRHFTEMNKDWLVLGMTKYGFSLAISYVFGFIFRSLPSIPEVKVGLLHSRVYHGFYILSVACCQHCIWNVDCNINI